MCAGSPGQTEVGELNFPAVRDQDVGWFHVPVNDAFAMSSAEATTNLFQHAEHLAGSEFASFGDHLVEVSSTDILHDQVNKVVADIMIANRDDVWMGNIRSDDGF